MKDFPIVEELVPVSILLYHVDFVDRTVIGDLARGFGKHCNTVQLLQNHSHLCHVSNINALFKAYGCPSCDQFINKAGYRRSI